VVRWRTRSGEVRCQRNPQPEECPGCCGPRARDAQGQEARDRRQAGPCSRRCRAGTLTTELEAIDKQIDAAKTKIDDLRHDLEQRKDFVDKAIYTLAKCFDYRRAVMNVFAYATDKVRGENDPDVQPYATQLREKYPVAISGHQEQIDNKVNALENCKKERREAQPATRGASPRVSPSTIRAEGAFEQRGIAYCDADDYMLEMEGKTWEQMDPQFFARRSDGLSFLSDTHIVEVLRSTAPATGLSGQPHQFPRHSCLS